MINGITDMIKDKGFCYVLRRDKRSGCNLKQKKYCLLDGPHSTIEEYQKLNVKELLVTTRKKTYGNWYIYSRRSSIDESTNRGKKI